MGDHMKDTTLNPFNITKSDDFSDQDINDYWVDISSGGFARLAKPTSPMPMLILGGKGSGKTHLMRHFSYPLQRIRYGDDLIGGIREDKYIGIYLRCGGLNSARFRNKGQTDETWADIFAYYMELWLSQLTLRIVEDAFASISNVPETEIVKELSLLVHKSGHTSPPSRLSELGEMLGGLQRELDSAINNSAITRNLGVTIAITRGDLIFGIPRIISEHVGELRGCLYLYLIDEFENLSESQQKYVNTLLRERKSPCSFKIGARLYGVRTYSTFSADEENKEGSEFEVLRLDAMLRGNKRYAEFSRRLVAKRLVEFSRTMPEAKGLRPDLGSLDKSFEELPKSKFSAAETAYVIEKYEGRERPYFSLLRQHLEQGLKTGAAPGVRNTEDVERVISLLSAAKFPLLEKLNIFLLYQEWSAKTDLTQAAKTIAKECEQYIRANGKEGRYERRLHHFKADLLAQLYRDTDQRQRYVGFSTLVEISSGLPRILLIVLKHIFAWAIFNGEKPFQGIPISCRSQEAGVLEASEWFYQDARMIGRDGQFVMDGINRLGTLFRRIRFSEKPSECSCATFSTDVSRCSEASRRVVNLAEQWSLLIDVGHQRDRNTGRVDRKYQLNRMLAPRWDLAIYRRGVLALTPQEVNAVFDSEHVPEFDRLAQMRVARMRAPFFGRRAGTPGDLSKSRDLFAEQDHD
jgi:hypothetical protein